MKTDKGAFRPQIRKGNRLGRIASSFIHGGGGDVGFLGSDVELKPEIGKKTVTKN